MVHSFVLNSTFERAQILGSFFKGGYYFGYGTFIASVITVPVGNEGDLCWALSCAIFGVPFLWFNIWEGAPSLWSCLWTYDNTIGIVLTEVSYGACVGTHVDLG
jgi:hypothetical protein